MSEYHSSNLAERISDSAATYGISISPANVSLILNLMEQGTR